ncbi:hypothetical protein [Novipirellula artificiosorum]|nr:hypothetical protein [Novipirellula artificiosorum]
MDNLDTGDLSILKRSQNHAGICYHDVVNGSIDEQGAGGVRFALTPGYHP